MKLGSKPKGLLWPICLIVGCLALFAATPVFAEATSANSAASLQGRYASLRDQLSHNQFQRPLYLDSSEGSDDLEGDIYALIDYPFATVDAALKEANPWCDVLILHLNIKYCRASQENRAACSPPISAGSTTSPWLRRIAWILSIG